MFGCLIQVEDVELFSRSIQIWLHELIPAAFMVTKMDTGI